MTTKITVECHCPDTHEVLVEVIELGQSISVGVLQNGETNSLNIWGEQECWVREVLKGINVE